MKTLVSVFALALSLGAFAQTITPPRARSIMRGTAVQSIRPCETDICNTNQPHACLEITYPETAWRTCVSNQGRRGLILGPTDLRRTATSEWIRVIREASVAEIFVPYHSLNLRLYDLAGTSATSLVEVNNEDAGPTGKVITLSSQPRPQVVAEMNDRGIAWLCKERRSISRRGQEMVLWAVQDAGNYDFIHEFRLRDDGSIGFRLGATGYNNPYYPASNSTLEAHMHTVLWRVDVDLNGSSNDTAILYRHREGHVATNPLLAVDTHEAFNNGREGTLVWNPEEFLTIGVEDASTNAYGHKLGYVIAPSVHGLSRHYGEQAGLTRKELFTKSDFAVTRFKQSERDALMDTPNTRYLNPDQYLLGDGSSIGFGISDNETVVDTDVVLWHRTAAHHDPHDEDHAPGDPPNLMTGITFVHWQGFDLQPHNLFDYNPLGAPSSAQCE
jgi:Cu2+-containing amine oxidase